MEEKIIIKGKLKDSKLFCGLIAVLGLVIYVVVNLIIANQKYQHMNAALHRKYEYSEALSYAFGLSGNGANYFLMPLIIVFPIIAAIIYALWSKVEITVTNRRIYGITSTGKRVDLPVDSISAVGTGLFSSLAVTTASGAIKFIMLKNRDELHKTISNLIADRQTKVSQTTIKQEIPQSNADELKKYKDLLDSGVITQAEFDAKKKELLGL